MDSGHSDADSNIMTLGVFSDLMKVANHLFYAAFCSRRDFISVCEKNMLLTTTGLCYLDRGGCRPLSVWPA